MKKVLKYLGIGLGVLIFILSIFLFTLNYVYKDDATFLEAAQNSDFEAMQKMIDKGYRPAAATFLSAGILRAYLTLGLDDNNIKETDINVIKFLIMNGALINETKTDKPSAVHEALLLKRDDIAILLINSGADINYLFKTISPLDLALKMDAYTTLNELIKRGAKLNSFKSNKKAFEKARVCVMQKLCHPKLLEEFNLDNRNKNP